MVSMGGGQFGISNNDVDKLRCIKNKTTPVQGLSGKCFAISVCVNNCLYQVAQKMVLRKTALDQ